MSNVQCVYLFDVVHEHTPLAQHEQRLQTRNAASAVDQVGIPPQPGRGGGHGVQVGQQDALLVEGCGGEEVGEEALQRAEGQL